MCSNPGVRTIEEELVNALFKSEAITEDGKACLGKVSELVQTFLLIKTDANKNTV